MRDVGRCGPLIGEGTQRVRLDVYSNLLEVGNNIIRPGLTNADEVVDALQSYTRHPITGEPRAICGLFMQRRPIDVMALVPPTLTEFMQK